MRRFSFFKHSTTDPAKANSVSLFVNDSGVLSQIDDEGTITAVGGGGSQPLTVSDFRFTEDATGGVYTATLDIAAGTTVAYFAAITERALAAGQRGWGAPTAELTAGDSVNPTGYADAEDLTGFSAVFDPFTDPSGAIDGEGFAGMSTLNGTYCGQGDAGTNIGLLGEETHGIGVPYPTDDTLTMTVTTTNGYPVAWQSNHAYDANAYVVAAGHLWQGTGGTSAGSAPDFAGNVGGSVIDNDIEWFDVGATAGGGILKIRVWTIAGVTATDADFA